MHATLTNDRAARDHRKLELTTRFFQVLADTTRVRRDAGRAPGGM